jgi:hypothetical protein
VKLLPTSVKMSHSTVRHYVKTDIAMSLLTLLCEILTWECQKLTYSLRKMTESCHNDIIALIDVPLPPEGKTLFSALVKLS